MSKNKLSNFKKLFCKRPADSHKGDYGKVFIFAGSEGMYGAGVLCSRGALRSGSGLVHLIVPKTIEPLLNLATPEVIVRRAENAKDLYKIVYQADAVAIGPGLGPKGKIIQELLHILNSKKFLPPIVLDADGITAFAGKISELKQFDLNLILTPHPGEMAKLLGESIEKIQQNRVQCAVETAKYLKCTLILKGNRTVIADESGRYLINETGNPGMASAGAGDVLTGMIAGFAGQSFSLWDAAVCGVYLHGLSGDLAVKDKGEFGMIASDLIEKIPYAIQKVS